MPYTHIHKASFFQARIARPLDAHRDNENGAHRLPDSRVGMFPKIDRPMLEIIRK
ncbi:MAG: hypothetical protein Q8N48_06365 [Thiobacillus sp.]|nr:hypothetical protein [Thiobacillus sp.]MDP2978436.1 hypothetical protein [Thiobacillus sp.]